MFFTMVLSCLGLLAVMVRMNGNKQEQVKKEQETKSIVIEKTHPQEHFRDYSGGTWGI